jgi:hypothetical protein
MRINSKDVFFGLILLFGLRHMLAGQILINEVQYSNQNTIIDNEGKTPDWIELFNSGTEAVNLEGYRLTDEMDLSDCWTFPDTLLLPGKHILIFASGKDNPEDRELHADFSLKLMAEPVILLDSYGEIIDSVDVECVPTDKSLGRYPDGSPDRVILSPTPGSTNNNADRFVVHYQKDSLSVSLPGGFYPGSVEIQFSNLHSSNTVYYTLDGEEPGPDGQEYKNTFTLENLNRSKNRFSNLGDGSYKPGDLISKANILRARVFSEGCPASNEIASTYFIDNGNVFKYKVPVVSVITAKDNLFDPDEGIYVKGKNKNYNQRGKKWEREAHIEIFDSNQVNIIDQNFGLRIFGGGSRVEPQKSLRLCAREEYGAKSFDYKFFPQKEIYSFQTLILSAERTFSPIIFKDEICHDLVSEMDIDYQAWQAVIVFIDGEYWGIHHLREYQRDDYFANNYNIQSDSIDIIEYLRGTGPSNVQGNDIAYQHLIDFISNHDLHEEENYKYVESLLNIDNTIDYYIAQICLANTDFPEHNNRIWRLNSDGEKWRWLFYDCEAGMHFSESDKLLAYLNAPEDRENTPEWAVLILKSLLVNKTFQKQFYARFLYLLNSTFSPGTVLDKIDSYQKFYAPLMNEHIYRWDNPNSLYKWDENIETIRQFAQRRPVYIFGQLQELFNNPFIVYPNPSHGTFSIDVLDANADVKYAIYDLQGKALMGGQLTKSDHVEINTSLDGGVYLLQVTFEQFIYTQKIVVKK